MVPSPLFELVALIAAGLALIIGLVLARVVEIVLRPMFESIAAAVSAIIYPRTDDEVANQLADIKHEVSRLPTIEQKVDEAHTTAIGVEEKVDTVADLIIEIHADDDHVDARELKRVLDHEPDVRDVTRGDDD